MKRAVLSVRFGRKSKITPGDLAAYASEVNTDSREVPALHHQVARKIRDTQLNRAFISISFGNHFDCLRTLDRKVHVRRQQPESIICSLGCSLQAIAVIQSTEATHVRDGYDHLVQLGRGFEQQNRIKTATHILRRQLFPLRIVDLQGPV